MESSKDLASLQGIFNLVAAGDTVELAFGSKKEYDSMRVMLLRKFANHKKLLEDLGGDFAQGKYLACAWNRETLSGSFSICAEQERKRKSYTLRVL
jgi:hypothetical protein